MKKKRSTLRNFYVPCVKCNKQLLHDSKLKTCFVRIANKKKKNFRNNVDDIDSTKKNRRNIRSRHRRRLAAVPAMTPLVCLNAKGPLASHRLCHDCWFNPETGFALEGTNHSCPGCENHVPSNHKLVTNMFKRSAANRRFPVATIDIDEIEQLNEEYEARKRVAAEAEAEALRQRSGGKLMDVVDFHPGNETVGSPYHVYMLNPSNGERTNVQVLTHGTTTTTSPVVKTEK